MLKRFGFKKCLFECWFFMVLSIWHVLFFLFKVYRRIRNKLNRS